ncbi:MAG: hypothetical protein AAGA09_06640 [Pseudomonadota bacterium]
MADPSIETSSQSDNRLTPEEEQKRRQRNVAIALGLALFMALVFAVTILRLGGAVAERTF